MENLFPIAQKLEGIEIDPYIYLHPTESSELLKCLKPCDVIFFSGALPYYMAKEIREQLRIPSTYYSKTRQLSHLQFFLSCIIKVFNHITFPSI